MGSLRDAWLQGLQGLRQRWVMTGCLVDSSCRCMATGSMSRFICIRAYIFSSYTYGCVCIYVPTCVRAGMSASVGTHSPPRARAHGTRVLQQEMSATCGRTSIHFLVGNLVWGCVYALLHTHIRALQSLLVVRTHTHTCSHTYTLSMTHTDSDNAHGLNLSCSLNVIMQ